MIGGYVTLVLYDSIKIHQSLLFSLDLRTDLSLNFSNIVIYPELMPL